MCQVTYIPSFHPRNSPGRQFWDIFILILQMRTLHIWVGKKYALDHREGRLVLRFKPGVSET